MITSPNLISPDELDELTLDVFIEYYNSNIPVDYPPATPKTCHEFQVKFPNLFKDNELWAIHKHRKRYMDWMSSHKEDKKT